jgi:hypothetical protein
VEKLIAATIMKTISTTSIAGELKWPMLAS